VIHSCAIWHGCHTFWFRHYFHSSSGTLANYLQVNYINAHATSTLAGDLAEVNAIKQVFKDPSGIKINATKVFQLINTISDIDSLPFSDG
jgi:hypothetical protein